MQRKYTLGKVGDNDLVIKFGLFFSNIRIFHRDKISS